MSTGTAELVHELLLAPATHAPGTPAVVSHTDAGVSVWTYRDLFDVTEVFVSDLDAAGCRIGDRVLVESDNSAAAIAMFLACSRLGLTFVPVSPQLPEPRLRVIAEICGATLFAQAAGGSRAALPGPVGMATFSESGVSLVSRPTGRPRYRQRVVSTDPAYMIFTSGTTGRPKGVVMSHRGVLSFYRGMLALGLVDSSDRVASTSPLQFDFSLVDLGLALGSGAAVVPVPRAAQRWPRRLARCLEETGATWLDAVPSVWRPMLRHEPALVAGLTRLRGTMFTGESFPLAELRLLRSLRPGLRIVNCFGSTETMAASLTEVPDPLPADLDRLSIGEAVPGAEFLLLDEAGQPITDEGVLGEIYLRTPALFSGYWGDAEGTRRAQVPDPLDPGSGQLLFRSRDLAYRGPAGELYFCGRADSLVKIRGNRVELGEVENRLREFPGVLAAAAVLVRPASQDEMLGAFVVRAPDCDAAEDALVAFCRETLPDYMAPGRIWTLPELPVNHNGKLDRAVLAERATTL